MTQKFENILFIIDSIHFSLSLKKTLNLFYMPRCEVKKSDTFGWCPPQSGQEEGSALSEPTVITNGRQSQVFQFPNKVISDDEVA